MVKNLFNNKKYLKIASLSIVPLTLIGPISILTTPGVVSSTSNIIKASENTTVESESNYYVEPKNQEISLSVSSDEILPRFIVDNVLKTWNKLETKDKMNNFLVDFLWINLDEILTNYKGVTKEEIIINSVTPVSLSSINLNVTFENVDVANNTNNLIVDIMLTDFLNNSNHQYDTKLIWSEISAIDDWSYFKAIFYRDKGFVEDWQQAIITNKIYDKAEELKNFLNTHICSNISYPPKIIRPLVFNVEPKIPPCGDNVEYYNNQSNQDDQNTTNPDNQPEGADPSLPQLVNNEFEFNVSFNAIVANEVATNKDSIYIKLREFDENNIKFFDGLEQYILKFLEKNPIKNEKTLKTLIAQYLNESNVISEIPNIYISDQVNQIFHEDDIVIKNPEGVIYNDTTVIIEEKAMVVENKNNNKSFYISPINTELPPPEIKPTNNYIVPIVATLSSLLVISVVVVFVLYILKRRKEDINLVETIRSNNDY